MALLVLASALTVSVASCGDVSPADAGTPELLALLSEMVQLQVNERAMVAREMSLRSALDGVPEPPADGCVGVRLGDERDISVRIEDDPLDCRDDRPCRTPRMRIVALDRKPEACTGEVCRYLGHVAYLLVDRDGNNENVIVYDSVSNSALHEGSDRLCELVGIRIDTVSGTLRWELEPSPGGLEYRFHEAPVIIVFGQRSEDRERKGCGDGAGSREP